MSKKYSSVKKHDPVDPDVKIPAAIRAASARSDALHKAAYQAPDADDTTNSQPGADDAANTEDQKGDNNGGDKGENDGSQNRQPEKTEPETSHGTPPAAQPSEKRENGSPAPGSTDWEHKYNSLKGRYDSQENVIRQLNTRLASMEGLVSRLESNPPATQKKPEQPPSELTFEPISKEDKDTFGEEFIDVAQRAALEKVSPEIARLNRTVEELRSQLGNFDNQTKQQTKLTLYQHMDQQLPNWREVNRDPNFIAWTNLPDPFSGVTRNKMLKDAFNKGDAPRVLRFFQGFLNDEAATDPANRVQPDKNPPKGNGKVPLETFAAPGRAKAPAATPDTAPGEKETITRAQIANFYRLKNQGHWRGNEGEMNALEQRIFQAQAEGRITD